jgi:hypothetical protein
VRRRALGLAIGLSFSVYLVPLVGPHAFFPLATWVLGAVTRSDRPAPWRLAEVVVALALQAGAGGVWYWIVRQPRSLRPLVLLLAVPGLLVAANWVYLIALPTRFLIEAAPAPERRRWPVACSVAGWTLTTPGRKPAVIGPTGGPLLVQDAQGRLARVAVTAPAGADAQCEVRPLALPPAIGNVAPVWIGDGGRALLSRVDRQTGAVSWEWIARPGSPALPLAEPPGRRPGHPAPVVSRDGQAVGWGVSRTGTGPPARSVVVKPLPAPAASAEDGVVIGLDALGPGGVVVLDVDPAAREVLVAIDERRFAVVGFDGTVRWGPMQPAGVEPLATTFRRLGDGWVAWDGYREDGGYVVAWSLGSGRGAHRVPRGRGVTDVAVHPEGRLVAVSVTTSVSVGEVPDAVYVLRTSDGAELFRRFLPRYARSAVAFPARDLFAYTEWDGAHAELVVLRVDPAP